MTPAGTKAFILRYGETCTLQRSEDLGYSAAKKENVTELLSYPAVAAYSTTKQVHDKGKETDTRTTVFISAKSCMIGDILKLSKGDFTIDEVSEFCLRGVTIAFMAKVIPC